MAYKVSLTGSAQITARLGEVASDDAGKVLLSRYIYQTLGSLMKNKTILDDYNNGRLSPEYVHFLDKLNEINLGTADADAIAMDKLLGDLGDEIDYHYSKDFFDIPSWLGELTEYFGYKNIVSSGFNIVHNGENIIYTQGYRDGN